VITDEFTAVVETSSVNSRFLKETKLFVILKLITSSYSMIMAVVMEQNNDLLHPLGLKMGRNMIMNNGFSLFKENTDFCHLTSRYFSAVRYDTLHKRKERTICF
jgi:hypothetical protein